MNPGNPLYRQHCRSAESEFVRIRCRDPAECLVIKKICWFAVVEAVTAGDDSKHALSPTSGGTSPKSDTAGLANTAQGVVSGTGNAVGQAGTSTVGAVAQIGSAAAPAVQGTVSTAGAVLGGTVSGAKGALGLQ